LSRRHLINLGELRRATDEVAHDRNASLLPLAEVLDGFGPLAQGRWAQWRRRSNSDHLPEQFEPILQAVIAFADPVLTGDANGPTWVPEAEKWL
jgi:hypothetical protein